MALSIAVVFAVASLLIALSIAVVSLDSSVYLLWFLLIAMSIALVSPDSSVYCCGFS